MSPDLLAEREALYRLLAENTTDLISVFDFEGNRIYASPSYECVLGYVPDEPGAGVHPDDRELALGAWRKFREGSTAPVTYRLAHRDGSYRWLEVSGRVVEYRGAPHVLAVSRDVTDRRRADEQRNLAEQRLRVFVDNASDGMLLFDAHGHILDVNARACENLGYSREELIGRVPAEFSEAAPARMQDILKKLARDRVVTVESRHKRKDGSSFPVEVRLRSFREHGQAFGIALVRDITDRQRAERELDESQKLFNIVVENTSDAVFVKDVGGRYLMINMAARRVLGRTAEEVLGRTVP